MLGVPFNGPQNPILTIKAPKILQGPYWALRGIFMILSSLVGSGVQVFWMEFLGFVLFVDAEGVGSCVCIFIHSSSLNFVVGPGCRVRRQPTGNGAEARHLAVPVSDRRIFLLALIHVRRPSQHHHHDDLAPLHTPKSSN